MVLILRWVTPCKSAAQVAMRVRNMDDQISWHVKLAVKPGQIENFLALTVEMVQSARDEPGVLNYERFVSDDSKLVHVYERYADSAAAAAHLRKFEELQRTVPGHG